MTIIADTNVCERHNRIQGFDLCHFTERFGDCPSDNTKDRVQNKKCQRPDIVQDFDMDCEERDGYKEG